MQSLSADALVTCVGSAFSWRNLSRKASHTPSSTILALFGFEPKAYVHDHDDGGVRGHDHHHGFLAIPEIFYAPFLDYQVCIAPVLWYAFSWVCILKSASSGRWTAMLPSELTFSQLMDSENYHPNY